MSEETFVLHGRNLVRFVLIVLGIVLIIVGIVWVQLDIVKDSANYDWAHILGT